MAKIKQIIAREILSSGSTPSVEVKCILESGTVGIASVPYGASAGIREAFVLLDGDKSRFMGKGMLKAVENVNKIIAPVLVGMEGENQKEIDQKIIELDGTERKTNLGANAILGVSLAVARASANDQKLPMYNYIRKAFNLEKYGLLQGKNYVLPNPMMVVIEGGAHADQSTDLQEYMISMIGNDSVKENSLVYLTPIENPQNNILTVVKKEICLSEAPQQPNECKPYFKVASNSSDHEDIKFNWLIIN